MAKKQSNFPIFIDDTLQTDRVAGQIITSNSYDVIEDALYQLETKVGVNSSIDTSSHDYKLAWIKGTSGLSASTISGTTISGSSIQASTITGSTIEATTITGTLLSATNVSATTISGATISGSIATLDTIVSTRMCAATISGTALTAITLQSINLTATNLSSTSAQVASLTATNLSSTSAQVGSLSATNLSSTNLSTNDIIIKSPWKDVRAYGASGDSVTDDSAAFAAALAAIDSGGGVLFIPPGTYNANVVISGQDDLKIIGSGANTKINPSSGIGIEISDSHWLRINNLCVNSPDVGLKIAGSAQSIFEKLVINSTAEDGIYVDGDELCELTFRDVIAYCGVNKVCFHVERTTTDDVGGLYLYNVRAFPGADTTGKNGYKFESSAVAPTSIFLFMAHCVGDGFAENAFVFDNISNVSITDLWASGVGATKAGIYINGSTAMRFMGSRLANSQATGYLVEIDGGSIDISFIGVLAYGAGGENFYLFKKGASFAGSEIRVLEIHPYLSGNYSFSDDPSIFNNGMMLAGHPYPAVDDTFYLGKNSISTPLAWKGLILKDTLQEKYFRVEVASGAIVATEIT